MEETAKPATSCHLTYHIPEDTDLDKEWKLECSVQVKYSVDCTYFCVVGFGPGGYCGIQQLPDNRRKAIFSMWNEKEWSVEKVESGEFVVVSTFGGEGTGIKTMRDCDWKEGEEVTFTVSGMLEDGYWYCRCVYTIENENEQLMAILRRSAKAGNPLNRTGFYSFIEDWDRSENAKGYQHKRKAKFLRPTVNGDDILSEATFTKVENGCDAFACDFAKAKSCHQGFEIQTGFGICDNNTFLRID